MEENESFIYRSYQDHNCLNVSLFSDSLYNYSFIPTPETPIKYVKVNLQIIQDEFGLNNFDNNNPSHINYLNSLFCETWSGSVNGIFKGLSVPVYEGEEGDHYIEDSRIRFSVEGIYFHQDDGGLNQINGTSHYNFAHYVESNFGINTDTEINIYLVPSGYHPHLGNTQVGGFGPPGNENTVPAYIGKVVMFNIFHDFVETGGRHWIVNPLIGHELGHVFGLHHTFMYSQYLLFYPQLFWPESNSWCSPMNDIHCSNNMMGYNNSKMWLAPLQVGHIHRVLASNPVRTRYLKYCDYDESQDILIDGQADWSIATVVGGNIIIERGNTLKLSCLLSMPKDGKIIIQPGAKLIIDGGIITNSCGDYWQGIYVEGDRTLPQTFANQGALILLNGAIIENAIDAVKLRGVQDNWWSNGGIIQATDATFRNNWRNVEFLSYQNVNSQGQEIDNISFFHNCTFLTDSNTPHLEHTSNVSMWNVKGVRFTNCNFTDLRTQLDYTAYRNARDGILSSTAEFYVNQCNFSGQKYGVYATSSQSHRMFSVNHSDFDTYRGIYFNSVNNVIIRNNHFNVDPGYTYQGGRCDDTYGLYIDQSTMFVVENNSFTSSSNGSTICGSVGLIARSTGSHTNEIYRNNFSGFTVGIETIGPNRSYNQEHGLLIKCNNFETSAWDIFVSEKDHGRHQGIRQSQGSSTSHSTTDLAGNLFGNNSPILVANYVNQGNPIAYYHHNPSSEPRVLPSVISGPITLWPSISDYNSSESCPVRIAKKTFELLANEMNAAQMQYEETNLFLLAYTDDGNTHLMTQQVEMAGSGNAYQTYQYLLQTSPFLSEEVLTALAAKEEGFNKAMIRDVMVENPQAAKSEEVNLTLDSRQDPLPAYMRWQINNGLYHLSEKEIMQQFMYLQKTRHDLALNEVIRGIVNQHEGFENAPTMDELLASVNDIRYQYLRAEYRFAKGDYASGMQLLNQISQHYPIPTDEAMQAHQEKVSFYSLLAQWNSDEYPDFTNLPEEVLAQLETFLEATPHVAGKALSLLMLNQAIEYEELIVYPTEEMLPKSGKVHSIADILLPEMAHEFRFSLYPNPSREYLTLDWCVESPRIAESGKIEIRNASGVLVHTMETHTPCNQQILPLAGWKSGTYTATLKLGSLLRKTITFVVAQ